MLHIILQGEELVLLPQRALLWPAQKTLLVADLHWGKSGHFRKHGIAIPANAHRQDELKLAALIREHNVERLIVAGDMFHSRQNNEVDGFAHWRNSHAALHIDLVTGNHDILPAEKYTEWNMTRHDSLQLGPFMVMHDAPATCEQFCIHGHIHPAVRLHGKGNQSLKLCCFAQDARRLILPAFGQFTGTHSLHIPDYEHIYVIAEDKVMQWK